VIVVTILLLIVSCLISKTKEASYTKQDTIRFNLLPSLNHNLLINCPNLEGKIFFIDDITLRKSDVVSKRLCTILNRDIEISEVLVNGKSIPIKQYFNFKAESFDPIIRVQEFENITKQCNMFELLISNESLKSDTVNVRFKYLTVVKDSLRYFNKSDNLVEMNGSSFWYPRNMNQNESINLSVKTTDQISMYIDGKSINYSIDKYIKVYKTELTDKIESPVSIIFKKR
jgi:hypothetical protein